MSKILKNTTITDIVIKKAGATVEASGQLPIDVSEYTLWGGEDIVAELTTHINSGDIVVNDGLNDLSAADGIRYIQYPDQAFNQRFLSDPERTNGFVSKNTQEAIEELRNSIAGKVSQFQFLSNGSTKDKWLSVGHPSNSSNSSPYVVPWSGKIVGLTFSNSSNGSDTDIELYVNGSLQYTWDIRNKRTSWITLSQGLASVSQGDRVSLFAKDAGVSPIDILGMIFASLETMPDGEGGTNSGD